MIDIRVSREYFTIFHAILPRVQRSLLHIYTYADHYNMRALLNIARERASLEAGRARQKHALTGRKEMMIA